MNDDEDRLGARLRRALRAEADKVTPVGDGLERIRERIETRRSRMLWMRPLAAAVGLAVLASAGVATARVIQQRDDPAPPKAASQPDTLASSPAATPDRPGTPAPAEPAGPTPSSPAPSPTTPAGSPTPPPPVDCTCEIYFVGAVGGEPRLFRETHTVQATGAGPAARIAAALRAMISATPRDPDYMTLWPDKVGVLAVTVSDDVAVVDFSALAGDQGTDGRMAIQQLVYTATANAASVTGVRLLIDGKEASEFRGRTIATEPITRAPAADVLPPAWIEQPSHAFTLTAPLTLAGKARVGLVGWDVLADGATVRSGEVRVADGGWTREVALDPGSYVVRVYEKPAEGAEPVVADTKKVTVIGVTGSPRPSPTGDTSG